MERSVEMATQSELEELCIALKLDLEQVTDDIGELRQDRERRSGVAWRKVLDPDDKGISLFDYQRELVGKICHLAESHSRGLVSLPTGAGKTRTAVAAALQHLESRPDAKWLWLAPTYELLQQAAATFLNLWDQEPFAAACTLGFRGKQDSEVSIWFQTPQAIRAIKGFRSLFDVIIFDEAHQLGAPTFRDAVRRATSAETALIGLSATPGRSDFLETEYLVDYFSGKLLTSDALGRKPVDSLIARGVLSQLVFKKIANISLTEKQRVQALALHCLRLAQRGSRTLVFTRSVMEAMVLSFYVRAQGFSASFVDGELSEEERDKRIQEFATGDTTVLFNQRLLATGYDCPAVSDVVLGSRIGSPVLFEQMVGRAARGPLTGGSSVARIWEFDDHLSIHGLPQSYYRFRDFEWQQA